MEEEAPCSASMRISIEGESVSEGGDVTLEVSARSGVPISVVMRQGEGVDEVSLDLLLSHSDFLRFLTLAQTLLSVAVETADDD